MTPARDRVEKLMKHTYYFTIAEEMAQRHLRREHAALVRAVRRLEVGAMRLPDSHYTDEMIVGYQAAITDVLALLAARKGRK